MIPALTMKTLVLMMTILVLMMMGHVRNSVVFLTNSPLLKRPHLCKTIIYLNRDRDIPRAWGDGLLDCSGLKVISAAFMDFIKLVLHVKPRGPV